MYFDTLKLVEKNIDHVLFISNKVLYCVQKSLNGINLNLQTDETSIFEYLKYSNAT